MFLLFCRNLADLTVYSCCFYCLSELKYTCTQSVTRSLIRISLNSFPTCKPPTSSLFFSTLHCDSSSFRLCQFASLTVSFSSPHSNSVFRIPFSSFLLCIYFIDCSHCLPLYLNRTLIVLNRALASANIFKSWGEYTMSHFIFFADCEICEMSQMLGVLRRKSNHDIGLYYDGQDGLWCT